MKLELEYIWIDGNTEEPKLRSKVMYLEKINADNMKPSELPEWSFDGSSTNQAIGESSDCILRPVRIYPNPFLVEKPIEHGISASWFVLCEVYDDNGKVHKTNSRADVSVNNELLYGFEQEYVILENGKPLGFPCCNNGYPKPQGDYYCGVGNNVRGRKFAEEHAQYCIASGINITGTNAEVMLGQWEYQVLSHGTLRAGDDLWISRYILHRLAEEYNYEITLHPKPVQGDWNGSGLHCNFSDFIMRHGRNETLRKNHFLSILMSLQERHHEHIKGYGTHNELRLTGNHETASINKFSWGYSDRGASIRIPVKVAKNWRGYLEDRRPASNADPYKIVKLIHDAIKAAK